jgi:WD40 repeat protein
MLPTLSSALAALPIALLVSLPVLAGEDAAAQNTAVVEVVANFGHAHGVESVALSPDGRSVLTGSSDRTLMLWDVATGKLLRTLHGHSDRVKTVAFSPDGRSVLSGSWDKTAKLWDAATGRLVHTFKGHSGTVDSVAFSPDGRNGLSGSEDKTIKLWDMTTGRLVRTLEVHSFEGVGPATFSPDGRSILSGGWDRTLKFWDAATGRRLHTIKAAADIHKVAFSPDGRGVLSAGWDEIELWDVATGRLVHAFEGHSGPAVSVAFSPDGRRITSTGGKGERTQRVWDVATGRLLLERRLQGSVDAVAFSADGRSMVSGGDKLQLWDVATGNLLRTFEGHAANLNQVVASKDGRKLLLSYRDTLKSWDLSTIRPVSVVKTGLPVRVVLSSDGRSALSRNYSTLGLWDLVTGKLARTIDPPDGQQSPLPIAFSSDGRRFLSDSDKTIHVWDVATGAVLSTFKGHPVPPSAAAFSPDGRSILSGGWDETLRLWDAVTGQQVRVLKGVGGHVTSIAFSDDGRSALSAGGWNGTLKLWDVGSGRVLRAFERHSDRVNSVAFSHDGRSAVSGGDDTTLKLWDVATGKLLRIFKGHASWVNGAGYSPDGRWVFSASFDGTIRFWSISSGKEMLRLVGREDGNWLAITPDGFFDFGGDSDNVVHLVRGMEVLSIGQVHQSLYNPDLVREALADDGDGEVAAAVKVINLEKVVDSGPAPAIAILAAEGSQSASDLVEVKVRIADRGKGVGRIEWRVNGITAAVSSGRSEGGLVYAVKQQLALDPGDNTIEVVAYNSSNLLASLPARTTVKFTGPADKTRPKLHILTIGIDTYVDGEFAPPLDFAEKDAETFAATMKRAAAGLYDEDKIHVTAILGPKATRANLERTVRRIADDIQPRDTFILFASGHATSSQGRFYLIPQDYRSGSASLADGAIGQDQLQDWLANRIRARKAIVLFDTCKSGALVAGHGRSRVDAPASEAAVGRLHEATGRPVLTAAAAGQYAIEGVVDAGGERHGVFTWAVLEALRKGDTNSNGLIELSELVSHVQSAVPKIAAGTGDPEKQTARFGSRGEDFVVARRLP